MKIDEELSFLTNEKQAFLKEQIQMLRENLPDLNYIILFGSYARGEERAESDMDLLVLTHKESERQVRGELCSQLEEKQVDLVFYTQDIFQSSHCLLVQQVRQEGIVIWKKN